MLSHGIDMGVISYIPGEVLDLVEAGVVSGDRVTSAYVNTPDIRLSGLTNLKHLAIKYTGTNYTALNSLEFDPSFLTMKLETLVLEGYFPTKLDVFASMPLSIVSIYGFTGDLTPLRKCPIENIKTADVCCIRRWTGRCDIHATRYINELGWSRRIN